MAILERRGQGYWRLGAASNCGLHAAPDLDGELAQRQSYPHCYPLSPFHPTRTRTLDPFE